MVSDLRPVSPYGPSKVFLWPWGPRPKAHGRGPRPNGEASYGDQGPGVQWHPTMGLKVPKTSRGQECKKYIHIHICICLCLCTLWNCCRPARYGSFNCQNKFDMFSGKQVLLTTHRLQFQTGEQHNQIGYIDLLADIAIPNAFNGYWFNAIQNLWGHLC